MNRQRTFALAGLTAIFTVATLAAAPLAKEQPLFTGHNLAGFKEPHGTWHVVQSVELDKNSPQAFTAVEGSGVLLNTTDGKTVDLFTDLEHGDCELHVEFCVPAGSNSGVYLQGRYEVQINDSSQSTELKYNDCGGIYRRWPEGVGFSGKAPDVKIAQAPGEWQSFDITFRAPRFDADGKKTENARFVRVVHNGELIHENVDVDGPTRAAAFDDEQPLGPLKLQGDHGPVAFRNLRIKPL